MRCATEKAPKGLNLIFLKLINKKNIFLKSRKKTLLCDFEGCLEKKILYHSGAQDCLLWDMPYILQDIQIWFQNIWFEWNT